MYTYQVTLFCRQPTVVADGFKAGIRAYVSTSHSSSTDSLGWIALGFTKPVQS
jgi:hypothetical protein